MNINDEFLDKFKIGLINKIQRIPVKFAIARGNLEKLASYFNNLPKNKQIDLLEELFDIQREFIIDCAEREQKEIVLPKLGRIRIKDCKKEVLKIQAEGRRKGNSLEETAKEIADHIRSYKAIKRNATKVIMPKFGR